MDTTKNCRLQSWTLYKSEDCRWISITILYVSFTNLATVGRLEQVQLCNRLIDQSADNITGLKCAKECLILKYKYIQNPWCYCIIRPPGCPIHLTNHPQRVSSKPLLPSAYNKKCKHLPQVPPSHHIIIFPPPLPGPPLTVKNCV